MRSPLGRSVVFFLNWERANRQEFAFRWTKACSVFTSRRNLCAGESSYKTCSESSFRAADVWLGTAFASVRWRRGESRSREVVYLPPANALHPNIHAMLWYGWPTSENNYHVAHLSIRQQFTANQSTGKSSRDGRSVNSWASAHYSPRQNGLVIEGVTRRLRHPGPPAASSLLSAKSTLYTTTCLVLQYV